MRRETPWGPSQDVTRVADGIVSISHRRQDSPGLGLLHLLFEVGREREKL